MINGRLKVLYSNVRSLVNKIDELKHTSYDLKPDIICLCETWSNDGITNAFLNIDDYAILCRKDRIDTVQGKGGGLIIYVKTEIKAMELKFDCLKSFNQCCAIRIKTLNDLHLNILLIYRPHSLYNSEDIDVNNQLLCDTLKKMPKPYIVVGDFNYSDINWLSGTCTAKSKVFFDTVNDLFLTQHINFPTHVSGTMPDLVLSSEENIVLSVESAGTLGSSDHDMIVVEASVNCKRSVPVRPRLNWHKADIESMKEAVKEIDWDTTFSGKSTEQSWNFLKEVLDKVVSDYVPLCKPKMDSRPLWMDKSVLREIRKKRKSWKKYAKTRDSEDYIAYKKMEKAVKKKCEMRRKNLNRNWQKM